MKWRLSVAAGLGAAAAGWVLAGVFSSGWARLAAVAAAAIGAAASGLATRRWPWGGWLPLPLAAALGLIAMWPDSGGPELIAEALRSGGISQPPVPFDPGWRFLLVAVTVLLAGASVGLGQARLAPLPGAAVVLVGVLVQPDGGAVTAVVGGLVLLAASLAVAVGGEESGGAAEFEVRRLARGGGALAGLVAVLVVLSQFGFLFPSADSHEVIPPKRPEAAPEVEDRVLFRVESDRAVPLRLGVLDVYDGRGFLTPPYDSDRFEKLGPPAAQAAIRATITVEDLGGHVLPGLASPAGVASKSKIEVDPRTGQLRLPKTRARKGLRYTVAGAEVPSAEALEAAPPAPDRLSEFAEAPPPPPAVEELLRAAPTSSYARVQYLRTALYSKVVAAGAGDPVDVPPARVAELLDGKEGSPWEITAAEVLLARWAGVPARFGYGYYDPQGTGEIRPRNGATWLEAYFEGHGWVPITGSPPRAKSSFSRAPKREDPLVKATDDLALVVYVPVRLTTVQLLYTQVRYWLVRVLPAVLGAVAVWALIPSALRALRRWRRRQWARSPSTRLLVAYAEFRDAAADLNVGAVDATPLEFLGAMAPDDEHTQLAWLVTRGLWGDLRRDLTDDDIRAAEDMAASVLRRLRRAHPFSSRLTAVISRTSLRSPWSTEVPGAPRLSWRRLAWAPTALLLAISTTTGAVEIAGVEVPAGVDGVELRREPKVEEAYGQAGRASIVGEGRVFSLRRADDVEGSLQLGAFVPGVSAADPDVRRAVVKSIGRGQFRLIRIGEARVYALDLPEQRFLLWFPPNGRSYALLVTRSTFELGDRVMAAIAGADVSALTDAVPVPDPRGGAPQ